MENLVLRFADGQVSGRGFDLVGLFTIAGAVSESGELTFVKQYLGQHQVYYAGQYDGEGTIHGRWWITEDITDQFMLSPVIDKSATALPVETLQ
jgi:hypothetical protein